MLLFLLACGPAPSESCPLWYTDLDGDGFGSGEGVASCEELSGRSLEAGDCEDRDSSVYPGAIDPPVDGVDQDCDGEDTCPGAQRVETVGETDCDRGWYIVAGDVNTWPEGDCICEVGGDLELSVHDADKLDGSLLKVGGNLVVRGEGGWLARGLESLVEVGGSISMDLQGDAFFPHLKSARSLNIGSPQGAEVHLEVMQELDLLRLEGNTRLRAPMLEHAEKVYLLLGGNSLEAPVLSEVETLVLENSATELPEVRTLNTLDLSGSEGTFEHLEEVATITVATASSFTAPKLSTAGSLNIGRDAIADVPKLRRAGPVDVEGELYSPSLTQAASIEAGVDARLTLTSLRSVETLDLTSQHLELPALTELHTLALDDSELSLPLLTELDSLDLSSGALHAPLLQELRWLAVWYGSAPALSLPKLQRADYVILSAMESLPELRTVSSLRLEAGGTFPELRTATGVDSQGPLIAPELTATTFLSLSGLGHDLASLRTTHRLSDTECTELPALIAVDEVSAGACQLNLLGLSVFNAPTVLWANAPTDFLLADGFPNSLHVKARSYGGPAPTLTVRELGGALSIDTDTPTVLGLSSTSQTVSGQLYISALSATSLGGLTHIESVGKDLTYCMPWVPDAEISAWLSTLSVGGEVLNRCP